MAEVAVPGHIGSVRGRSWRDPDSGCTAKQLKFVEGVAQGQSYQAAYRGAYTTAKCRDDEVQRRAWELSRDPVVSAELARMRERAREKVAYGVADAVHEAELVRQMAMEDRQAGAATGAITLKAKLLGLMTDKIEQTTRQAPMTLPELEAQLRNVMGQLGLPVPVDLADVARDNVIPIDKRA